MEYEIIRSKKRRKLVQTRITPDGRTQVYVPYNLPESEIDRIIEKRSDWIDRTVQAHVSEDLIRNEMLCIPPQELPLLGAVKPVKFEKPYGFRDCFYLPEQPLKDLLPILQRIYRDIARRTLVPRTLLLAGRLGISVSDVKINSARTRWGSCSSRHVINLSWKLIAASQELIDYVIVHELCHTCYMDHSQEFWTMVQQVIPDYKQRIEGLKEVSKVLYRYGLDNIPNSR